jgi:hypothetical protein
LIETTSRSATFSVLLTLTPTAAETCAGTTETNVVAIAKTVTERKNTRDLNINLSIFGGMN